MLRISRCKAYGRETPGNQCFTEAAFSKFRFVRVAEESIALRHGSCSPLDAIIDWRARRCGEGIGTECSERIANHRRIGAILFDCERRYTTSVILWFVKGNAET